MCAAARHIVMGSFSGKSSFFIMRFANAVSDGLLRKVLCIPFIWNVFDVFKELIWISRLSLDLR